MRRILGILFAAMLLVTALPSPAAAQTEETIVADHLLVYNPLPYAENGNQLYSGSFRSPVTEEDTPEGEAPYRSGRHRTGSDFSVRTEDEQTKAFWICTDLNTYAYDKRTFRLAAETEHCDIWALDSDAPAFSEQQVQTMAEQFESVIYPTDTQSFGPMRDLGGDGRLHIVTYAMNSLSVCGFFDSYDLYSADEIAVIDPEDFESYNCLPIINVNTRMADDETTVLCTLAHEFQHLLLRSAVLASPANADRLGKEKTIGTWLNEGFSMAAEELCYPGAVREQGYLDAFARSEKVRLGMSYQTFETTATDVGAYGQSFLFAAYLKAQLGETVFADWLQYWRDASDAETLTEAQALCALLDDEQKTALDGLASYTDAVTEALGSKEAVLLSKFALAFRLAVLLNADGLSSIGIDAEPPVYSGAGRMIEGGGALLLEIGEGFSAPPDAEDGLVYVWIGNGEVLDVSTVPQPEAGFYVLAAEYRGQWFALPAVPAADGMLAAISIDAPVDGTVRAETVPNAIFRLTRTADGFRIGCEDERGMYALIRSGESAQTLAVADGYTGFCWRHFVDGGDRLQADGYYGRAILYNGLTGRFGYFAPAYFENASFAHPRLLRVAFVRGDANLDGTLTAADASAILRKAVGLTYLNAPMRAAADADGDGMLSAADASKILRILVQLESEEASN